MPDKPTLYDHLVLSLREKDLIATFNWDPFLFDACWRNHAFAPLPHVVYLHGSVRVGYCAEDRRKGLVGTACSICGMPFTPSKLLYPITKKDYSSNPFTSAEWNTLRSAFKDTFVVTVFGYSAPQTDVDAVALMRESWGDLGNRNFEEFEFIDIKDQGEMGRTWRDFIFEGHYRSHRSFYASLLGKHPRRTCESLWNNLIEAKFTTARDVPQDVDFPTLYEWLRTAISAETR